MKVERRDNEILIRLSSETRIDGLQRIINFLKYREIMPKSKASQNEIDDLASGVQSKWWDLNKDKYLK